MKDQNHAKNQTAAKIYKITSYKLVIISIIYFFENTFGTILRIVMG